jgi:methylmalonyl-CoA mutase
MFARGLFESAGIEITENAEPERLPGMVEEFRGSGAPLVCLCSSDDVYADLGSVTARALKDAGARMIAVAGLPDRLAERFRDVDIDLYVHSGQDALAFLTGLYDNLFETSDR